MKNDRTKNSGSMPLTSTLEFSVPSKHQEFDTTNIIWLRDIIIILIEHTGESSTDQKEKDAALILTSGMHYILQNKCNFIHNSSISTHGFWIRRSERGRIQEQILDASGEEKKNNSNRLMCHTRYV
jgi:hypothetical protein